MFLLAKKNRFGGGQTSFTPQRQLSCTCNFHVSNKFGPNWSCSCNVCPCRKHVKPTQFSVAPATLTWRVTTTITVTITLLLTRSHSSPKLEEPPAAPTKSIAASGLQCSRSPLPSARSSRQEPHRKKNSMHNHLPEHTVWHHCVQAPRSLRAPPCKQNACATTGRKP